MVRPQPAQNRVTPWGDIVATAARGAWMGNRGRLHLSTGTRTVVRQHQTKAWITCVLDFKGRRTPQWEPGHYTPLFFLDEAVSFATGHRPCAECRRANFLDYQHLWTIAVDRPKPRAPEMDAELHRARRAIDGVRRATWRMPWQDVPDGTFIVLDGEPMVVVDDHLTRWDRASGLYGAAARRPLTGKADVLTPRMTVDVLRHGYCVNIDAAARKR